MPGPISSQIWGKSPALSHWVPVKTLPDGTICTSASMTVDEGVATSGGATALNDTTKDWGVDILEGALLKVTVAATGKTYERLITANTATQIVFDTIAPAAVAAGDVYEIVKQVDPMTPMDRGVIHNVAYVTPNNFFVAALAPIVQPTLFRCQAAFSVAGVLSSTITRGGVPITGQYNHGVVLPANALFEFDLLVQDGDTINYIYSVNCTILTFKVLEIPSAI